MRRAVLEAHVDPSAIKGSGKDGRLTKDDVLAAAKSKGSAPAQAGAPVEAKAPSSPHPPLRPPPEHRLPPANAAKSASR